MSKRGDILQNLNDIHIHWTLVDATATADASDGPKVPRIVVELAVEPVAKALGLCRTWVVTARNAPVPFRHATVPGAEASDVSTWQLIIAHVKAATRRAGIGAKTTTQAAVGQMRPIRMIKVLRPCLRLRDRRHLVHRRLGRRTLDLLQVQVAKYSPPPLSHPLDSISTIQL
jgi:hypothetical protein